MLLVLRVKSERELANDRLNYIRQTVGSSIFAPQRNPCESFRFDYIYFIMLAKPAAGNCFVRTYLFDFELFVFTLEITERENGVYV